VLDYANLLNPQQLEAVRTTEGALLIIAGAGSGKTRVITYRMAYLLDRGIPQSQILALTFTNKAAREMAGRVRELTGKKLQSLTVSTFHAFGVTILREFCSLLGWRENFSIYDETDRNQLIKDTARELRLFTKEDGADLPRVGSLVSNIKTGRWHWGAGDRAYALEAGEERFKGEFPGYSRFYDEYQAARKVYNAFDFDDLIVMPLELFRSFPDVAAALRNRYRYILVDEFQDTSARQYDILKHLADKNIAVVGDDDQSIYSWRGANYENIRSFERDFPGVKEIRLLQNYRSTGTILAAANGVISHNANRKDKELWSGKGAGKPVRVYFPENEIAEAEFIADAILGMRFSEKLPYEDFGVLMRANSQSHPLEEAFLSGNIPYVMSGGISFFERKEIKDVVSFLRVCANHDDDVNLLRIINTPRRGIGKKTIETLGGIAASHRCSLWRAIKFTLERTGAQAQGALLLDDPEDTGDEGGGLGGFVGLIENGRKSLLSGRGLSAKVRQFLETLKYNEHLIMENQKNERALRFKLLNVERLLDSMSSWEDTADNPSLYDYLNRITLISQDDQNADEGGRVNLMTIHAAKGLEFPVVFIAGAEDGLIPHERSLEEDEGNIEEERRLFYVAITRAKERLYITSCKKRKKNRAPVDCAPSRFLDEIPGELVEISEPESEPLDRDAAAQALAALSARFREGHCGPPRALDCPLALPYIERLWAYKSSRQK
jgi:DNA helicase-2/ATP-dependent DNA helicase PcrA